SKKKPFKGRVVPSDSAVQEGRAPPAAPGSASRATTAGRGGGGRAPGAAAPGRGGAPLGLLTRGLAGRPSSSAPASGSAPAPAPARAAARGCWRCQSDVSPPPPRCRLGVVVSGCAAPSLASGSRSPAAQLSASGHSGDPEGPKLPSGEMNLVRTRWAGRLEERRGPSALHRLSGARGLRWD
ncbi:LOW QUALITY PROTEIN: hypothetical protein J0S82_006926, partial [Galemys pyrenaicus]